MVKPVNSSNSPVNLVNSSSSGRTHPASNKAAAAEAAAAASFSRHLGGTASTVAAVLLWRNHGAALR